MRTILLVDDDAISLSLRAAILAREGYRVLTATSAQTALALVENPAVRMAILDYRMPEMNGEELAKEMRRRNVRVPIVILSGEVCLPATVVNYTDAELRKDYPIEFTLAVIRGFLRGRTHRCASAQRRRA